MGDDGGVGWGVIAVQMLRPGQLKGSEKSYRHKPLLVFLLLSNAGCYFTEHHLGDAALNKGYLLHLYFPSFTLLETHILQLILDQVNVHLYLDNIGHSSKKAEKFLGGKFLSGVAGMLCCTACGILVPQPGFKSELPGVEA